MVSSPETERVEGAVVQSVLVLSLASRFNRVDAARPQSRVLEMHAKHLRDQGFRFRSR